MNPRVVEPLEVLPVVVLPVVVLVAVVVVAVVVDARPVLPDAVEVVLVVPEQALSATADRRRTRRFMRRPLLGR